MSSGQGEEQLIRGYLLGRLSAEEREAVGRRLMEDAEFFDQVQDHEDELIDAAARGELDPAETSGLTEMLRSTSQEHRLEFAKALARAAGAGHRTPVWRYAAVAAGVVLACSSAWLAWDNYILRGRLAAPATTGQEQQVAMVYPLYLPAGVTRGSGVGQGLRIPAGAGIVELQLEFSGGTAGSYSVELRTTGERTVATQRAEPPGAGAPLRVPVSAKLLAPGRYEVEVGTETDGVRRAVEFYYFSILGK